MRNLVHVAVLATLVCGAAAFGLAGPSRADKLILDLDAKHGPNIGVVTDDDNGHRRHDDRGDDRHSRRHGEDSDHDRSGHRGNDGGDHADHRHDGSDDGRPGHRRDHGDDGYRGDDGYASRRHHHDHDNDFGGYLRPACGPDEALFSAARMGLRHPRIDYVGNRSIGVSGRSHGRQVSVRFGRFPGCPVLGG